MADDFFGFDTDFPSAVKVLGRPGLDDELLTDDVEEEYDALNDETFGQAANDDWEEAHEKLSELIKNNNIDVKSYFHDSLLENDDSQEEIVSKSISQLGLEDDLDDPAIISRNCQPSSRLRSAFGPSPPPPAILETEICGSPKTHSIWSTTPKDSGVSFLQSISHSPSNLHQQDSRGSLNSASDNVFLTPQKAWRAEELERDLLSGSNKEQSCTSSNSWPQSSQISSSPNENMPNKIASHRFPSNLIHYRNKLNQRVFTQEEVERHMHTDARIGFQNKVGGLQSQMSPMTPPMIHPSILPPGGNNLNMIRQSSPGVPLNLRGPPIIRGALERPFGPYPNHIHRQNILNHQMPRSDYLLHNPPVGGVLNHPFIGLPRPINHPFMPNWKPFFAYDKHDSENYRNDLQNVEDEYAGLMTQREKDWLIKIQMLLLKSDNPYVEDYYYTTQLTRKFKKKYSENAKKGGGDAPELILPETSKPENKAYVPTQFKGSLGKLQVVSVNFPRKVLDIKVTRPLEDDEGRIETNQSLMKYRRLLLDIEKLYTCFLEIDDEEKRILAKPDTGEAPHRQNIANLTLKIFHGLCSENSADDTFQNIMTVRKGRNLLVRVFPLFSKEQQLQCLTCLCRSLSLILKKDQNDLVLARNFQVLTKAIESSSLPDLVQLGEALGNGMRSDSSKEKNFVAAFKNKFGSSMICAMVKRAEDLYSGYELFETDIQTRWASIILYIVDIICSVENMSLNPLLMPSVALSKHLQRFVVDTGKYEILKERLEALETDSKNSTQSIV